MQTRLVLVVERTNKRKRFCLFSTPRGRRQPKSSSTTMPSVLKTIRITNMPSAGGKRPPDPLLGHTAIRSSEASQETDQNILERQLLSCDQCCLVTGNFSTQLRVHHLVNTIHVNEPNREKKQVLKGRVVRLPSFLKCQAVLDSFRPGVYPHQTTVWAWKVFLGWLAELRCP